MGKVGKLQAEVPGGKYASGEDRRARAQTASAAMFCERLFRQTRTAIKRQLPVSDSLAVVRQCEQKAPTLLESALMHQLEVARQEKAAAPHLRFDTASNRKTPRVLKLRGGFGILRPFAILRVWF